MKRYLLLLIMTCGIYCPNMAHGTCLPMPIVENKDNHKGEKRTLNMTVYGKKGRHDPPRSTMYLPSLELEGNELYFTNYVPSCTLQLVDETGNIFYETIIPEGTECWELPTDQLAGCELRLIIDDVCYYCIL